MRRMLQSLAGVRVLDLSRVLAGPWATQMLGDLGADIVKVEKPGSGDDTRHWGPPFDPVTGDAAYFQCANRNKRSLALDFSHPQGAALLRELAGQCDVLVENFKPGSLARHGLAPEQLLALHPRLVVCSISGFGHSGPLRERAGYDFVVQALGGLMSVTGSPDGEPQKVGVAVADLFTGLHAAVAILAALRHRDATGQGQHIDLALFDCQLAMLANLASQYLAGGAEPRRLGNAHPSIAPYETLPCADGELVLAVGNDGQFARLCERLGRPEWANDTRFARNADRLAHRPALRGQLAGELCRQPRAHWLALFETAGVPASSVHTVAEALQHPQATARGMLEPLDPRQPGDRPARMSVASPLKLSATPVRTRCAPPRLGAQGQELLAEFGLDDRRIDDLLLAGVLALPAGSGWTGAASPDDTRPPPAPPTAPVTEPT
jgi:crotonobetainyl-CoA:carnitine CoA-transferase CaiB-like acyl-CoA transferase